MYPIGKSRLLLNNIGLNIYKMMGDYIVNNLQKRTGGVYGIL